LLPVDEGPMRGDLRRQIALLEAEISRFVVENCPDVVLPEQPIRGPAVLSSADLEQVRDELLQLRADLHEHIVGEAWSGGRDAAVRGTRSRWWDSLRGR
jgi:hypothetical protein